jgi:hypothetical protein
MVRTKASAALAIGTSIGVYAAISILHPAHAHAQSIIWAQDSILPGLQGHPGCAKKMAVGPINVPWVLGRTSPDGGKNFHLYHVQYLAPCSGCFPEYQWTDTRAAGVQLYVDAGSFLWLLTSDGHVWTPMPAIQTAAWTRSSAGRT